MFHNFAFQNSTMPSRIPTMEVFPFKKGETTVFFNHISDNFTYPAHYHREYEITLIVNGQGMMRSVGNSSSEISTIELVLVGSNLLHCWKKNNITNKNVEQITILFTSKTLLHLKHLDVEPVEKMLNSSAKGLLFPANVAIEIKEKLINMKSLSDKKYFAVLSNVLNIMAASPHRYLTETGTSHKDNENLENTIIYIYNNFSRKITFDEIAQIIGMSHATFNRFIKKQTGKTFINLLNNIRVNYACRWLTTGDLSVAEIALKAGFSTLSNFNRHFRNSKGCTPLQYREKFYGSYRYI